MSDKRRGSIAVRKALTPAMPLADWLQPGDCDDAVTAAEERCGGNARRGYEGF
jgi:hypothetical protein